MLPRSAGFGLSEQIMRICKSAGFSPNVQQDALELPTICGLVAAGFGVSLVPSSALLAAPKGTTFRLLDPEQTVDALAAYSTPDKFPALAAFLKVLRSYPKVVSSMSKPHG